MRDVRRISPPTARESATRVPFDAQIAARATRSAPEVDFLAFAARHLAAFGPPQVNVWVHGFEIDARWPEARTTEELDSLLHHDNDPAFERDRAKWNALTAAGEAVFPLTSRRLRREPTVVAAQLARLLASRRRGGGAARGLG